MSNLTKRQKEYLLLITREYIASGVPVGSASLIREFGLDVSPATVRNEMATLEKKGYLEKCHTSSGRIPSSKGFLLYANHSKNNNVSDDIEKQLKLIFAKRTIGIDQVLEEAVEAISTITNFTLVTGIANATPLVDFLINEGFKFKHLNFKPFDSIAISFLRTNVYK